MKSKLFSIGVFLSMIGHGQTPVPNNVRAAFTLEQGAGRNGFDARGGFLYGVPIAQGAIVGDAYLDTLWTSTSIEFYDNKTAVNNLFTRYDILKNGVEIKAGSQVRFLPAERIKTMVYNHDGEKHFVNAREFDSNRSNLFQVLSEGSATLLKQVQVTIKKSDYNQSLDIGSRHDKLLRHNVLYCSMDGTLILLPKSQRKLKVKLVELGIIGAETSARLNDEKDVVRLFEDYNMREN